MEIGGEESTQCASQSTFWRSGRCTEDSGATCDSANNELGHITSSPHWKHPEHGGAPLRTMQTAQQVSLLHSHTHTRTKNSAPYMHPQRPLSKQPLQQAFVNRVGGYLDTTDLFNWTRNTRVYTDLWERCVRLL